MAQIKRAIYKVDNGTDYDIIHFETEESMVKGVSGKIEYFAQSTPPQGYLKCNGAAISRTAYPELFAAIGTYYGAGDGSSTFNVPDIRGDFIRCLDDNRGVDLGRVLGSHQEDMMANHRHTQTLKFTTRTYENGNGLKYTSGESVPDDVTYTGWDTTNNRIDSTETRPKNTAFLACIRYC
ncbi:phage tail protein [Clostridium felsineum]|uniref:Uncharacterized protein n=1 Tax=Clostridium felsineum TaxID=36839 RepID=A0A1S8LYQ0_9CLOT|nr:phage tail protein [Clostridium felsineum]URZ07533.1 hypothetical protein CLROS_028720 [Clostridium felsineum]URZ12564.1 hypothetical protein CROST_032870 [Clostridium felsineum]